MFKLVILESLFSAPVLSHSLDLFLFILKFLWCLFKIPTHMLESYVHHDCICHCISQLVKACVRLVLCLSTSAYYYVVAQYKGLHDLVCYVCFVIVSSIVLCTSKSNKHSYTYTHMHNLLSVNPNGSSLTGFSIIFDVWRLSFLGGSFYHRL